VGWLERLKETNLDKDFLQIFQSKIELEIIYFYFSNPFSIFTPRSLALALGRKKQSVEKSLDNLKKAGLLKVLPQRGELEAIYYYQPDAKSEKMIEKLFECLLSSGKSKEK